MDNQQEEDTLNDEIRAALRGEELEPKNPVTEKAEEDKSSKADAEPAVEPAEPTAPVTTSAEPKYKAPISWNDTVKQKWSELPEEIQAEIARREEDVHKGFTKLDEERNFGKTIKEIVSPYMPMIQAEGGTADGAIRDLMNTAYVLRTGSPEQKAMLLQNVAKQYGIDLSKAQEQEQYVDPTIAGLQQQLAELKQQTDPTRMQQFLQSQQEAVKIQSEVTAFATDPKHEHYEKVKPLMATLLSSGQAKDLQEAYDRACWADPDVRSTLTAAVNTQVEEAKRKLEAKRNAGSSITGSPAAEASNSTKDSKQYDDVESAVRAALRQHSSDAI